MGFFSWITSDTKKSIPSSYSNRDTFTVHMITENGVIYTEEDYEGYGVFGGKDIYELIAELNGLRGIQDSADTAREKAINLVYKTIITDGVKSYECNKDFQNWGIILPAEGKTPNQLVEEGWAKQYPYGYGDFTIGASHGLKLPKLVEHLPAKGEDLKKFWARTPYPENCPDQGYFYPGDDNDEEDDEIK